MVGVAPQPACCEQSARRSMGAQQWVDPCPQDGIGASGLIQVGRCRWMSAESDRGRTANRGRGCAAGGAASDDRLETPKNRIRLSARSTALFSHDRRKPRHCSGERWRCACGGAGPHASTDRSARTGRLPAPETGGVEWRPASACGDRPGAYSPPPRFSLRTNRRPPWIGPMDKL